MNGSFRRWLAPLVIGLLPFGCGSTESPPRAQWIVVVTTDAPVPQIGDRLLVELLDEAGELACTNCRLDAVSGTAGIWDFGVEASPKAVTVRVRLYRGDHVGSDGQPIPSTTIDQMGRLPSIGDEVKRVGLNLILDCISRPADLKNSKTCTGPDRYKEDLPTLGEPVDYGTPTSKGTSHFLKLIKHDCPPVESIPSGMACVPGALFFLGDSLAPAPHTDVLAAAAPERLVGLSSFLIDRNEVTVKEFFSQMPDQKTEALTKCPGGMKCKDAISQPNTAKFYCNISAKTPSDLETNLPINCVSHELAVKYCASLGKRLPREAEWELAAANSSRETRFPWGNNSPTCLMTNVAQGVAKTTGVDDLTCRGIGGQASGALALSSLPVDQDKVTIDLAKPWLEGPDSQTVFALAGNVSEWTSDIFYSYMEEPCTKDSERPGVLILPPVSTNPTAYCGDILAAVPADPDFSVRGGSFRSSLESTWSAVRSHESNKPALPSPEIGFRCVKDL